MSVSDLVQAALALINEHGGKLPGNKVSLLYQKNSKFKRIISDHGGLKKFCANCQELEFVETSSRDDLSGIQKQGTAQAASLEALLAAQTAALEALLAFIDQNCGQVATSQLPPFYAVHEDVVKAQGGIKRFCGMFQELEFVTSPVNSRDRHIRRSDMRPAGQIQEHEFVDTSSRDDPSGIQKQGTAQTAALEALLALIDQNGGQVATSQLPPFYAVHEDAIKAQGFIKKFCGMFQELEFVTSPVNSRDRYIRRSDVSPAGQIALAAVLPDIAEDKIVFKELSSEVVAATNLAGCVVLKVSEIRWSQDCIKTVFKDGRALVGVVQELIASPELLKQLPSMEVLQVGDKWFAVNGNRRLWVLKEYARHVCPDLTLHVPVFKGSLKDFRYMLAKRFTTPNNGVRVDVVLEHRAKEYQRFQSMRLALDHSAGKSNSTSQSQVSEGSATTASGCSSDAGDQ